MNNKNGLKKRIAAVISATLLAAGLAQAQSYPTKPIHLIVNQAAGGATDVAARAVGARMSQLLGQPMVPDNKVGASGVIGADYAAKAAPDGYTVLFGNSGAMALVPAMDPKVPYDPIRDFIAVGHVVMVDLVMVVRRDLDVKTIAQAIALAKANPGKISFASGGTGTSGHVWIEYLRSNAGANFLHVPFNGDAPAVTAVMGGHADFAILSMPGAQTQLKAGLIKPVVITGKTRAAAFPDVPTIYEAGFTGFQGGTWSGLHVPAGTPAAIVEKLNTTLNRALAEPALRDQILGLGMIPAGGTPREYEEFIVREMKQAGVLMKSVGAKRD